MSEDGKLGKLVIAPSRRLSMGTEWAVQQSAGSQANPPLRPQCVAQQEIAGSIVTALEPPSSFHLLAMRPRERT